ncbi:hypothetical protein PENTCL1PPCAC_17531 [Pristionchus entomophagus]|uniref:CULT domain-containing protein n=1 Tax=Pristionchus entomophagus TaxID=358040 RepID=A0AAV5TM08_9BILA|nr:hypothetical protein PENTCL1PPCAC_17531 [Pristionchus entomophagus]
MADSDSSEDSDSEILAFPLEQEEEGPIEDDSSRPEYDTENIHSYLYTDTGPVTYVNQVMFPLEDGQELNEMLTTFHSFPLNIGDEVPHLKLDENDNRAIKSVIQLNSYLISINCGGADSYEVACWLRDRSKANEISLFSKIDVVAMSVISHAIKEEGRSEKMIAVCRVVGRVRLHRVEKSMTGLIFSYGTVFTPSTHLPYDLATLSRAELALSPKNKEKSLQHLLTFDSRLIMQCATSCSIDSVFSIMKWMPNDLLEKMKKEPHWKVAAFMMRALPIDRRLHHILIKKNNTDAQIAILNSLDYSNLRGVCNSCHEELFNISDMVYLKPWICSAVFVNPAEYVFDTVILRHTIAPPFGVLDESFSWFSGYGWRHLICGGNCRSHLGWRFESNTLRPSKFCALQRGRFRLQSVKIEQILGDNNAILHENPSHFFRHQISLSQQ